MKTCGGGRERGLRAGLEESSRIRIRIRVRIDRYTSVWLVVM